MNPFQQAQKMMKDLENLREEFEKLEVTGEAGTGMVKITMTCSGCVQSVKLAQELINPNEIEILEDLIIAAFNDAQRKAETAKEEKTKTVLPNMPNIPGIGF